MLSIHYSIADGEIFFSSEEPWSETVAEIYSVVHNQETESDIYVTSEAGLSLSVPIFIQFFDSIIQILSYCDEEISFSNSLR